MLPAATTRRPDTVSEALLTLHPPVSENPRAPFRPKPVRDFDDAGLHYTLVESLVLKFLLNNGIASGRRIAEELGLPFGFPGNGKTSIAEQLTRCFRSTVWIPRVIDAQGQLIKLFDLAAHEPVISQSSGLLRHDDYDHRWIEIRRPTLIAGGELRME